MAVIRDKNSLKKSDLKVDRALQRHVRQSTFDLQIQYKIKIYDCANNIKHSYSTFYFHRLRTLLKDKLNALKTGISNANNKNRKSTVFIRVSYKDYVIIFGTPKDAK
uniref:Uncharacterized protein n=1 Tax=Rhizophagus irregularis (strain DAOM 181602 / DAOM 197198 / MUCL 43194) TaxID=747089 RepID=U9SLE2_RHIID